MSDSYRALDVLLTGGQGPVSTWNDGGAAFRTLDDSGCGGIWLTDHLFFDLPTPECLVLAAVAASHTTNCRIGTGVLQLPLRRTAAVAKAAATIAVISGGRFDLGLGAGQHVEEYDLVGVDFGRRGRDLDDGIVELRRCWSTDIGWFRQLPSPPQIPLWIGGRSDAALDRAAASGDGWLPLFIGAATYAKLNRSLDDRIEKAGRSVDEVARGVTVMAAITSSAWSREDALRWAGTLFPSGTAGLEHYVLTGSAEECVAQFDAYRQAGSTRVSILVLSPEPVPMFLELNAASLASPQP